MAEEIDHSRFNDIFGGCAPDAHGLTEEERKKLKADPRYKATRKRQQAEAEKDDRAGERIEWMSDEMNDG